MRYATNGGSLSSLSPALVQILSEQVQARQRNDRMYLHDGNSLGFFLGGSNNYGALTVIPPNFRLASDFHDGDRFARLCRLITGRPVRVSVRIRQPSLLTISRLARRLEKLYISEKSQAVFLNGTDEEIGKLLRELGREVGDDDVGIVSDESEEGEGEDHPNVEMSLRVVEDLVLSSFAMLAILEIRLLD